MGEKSDRELTELLEEYSDLAEQAKLVEDEKAVPTIKSGKTGCVF